MYSVHEEILISSTSPINYSISVLRIYPDGQSFEARSEYVGICVLLVAGEIAEIRGLIVKDQAAFNRRVRTQIGSIIKSHGCKECRVDRPQGKRSFTLTK